MFFVGREKETRAILRALEGGRNVLLQGRFGIGRTALTRHVSEVMGDRWHFHFLDFSETPRLMCHMLFEELHAGPCSRRPRKPMRYKAERYRILQKDMPDKKHHVIVFDNVAKLTRAKIAMLRHFRAEERFPVVAIIESFLEEKELRVLSAILAPTTRLSLGYLSETESHALLSHVSATRRLKWNEAYIRMLAETARGYPLGMVRRPLIRGF